ncbi:MAG: tail fiber protein, partial [Bacteroidota bacterium]
MLHSQVSINEDNTEPAPSAMLDISSNDKGLLIPRMDSTSRNNITNPAEGLMVFDSTTNSFWYYITNWIEIGRATLLADTDGDTRIAVEKGEDDDLIKFDLAGTEFMRLDSGRIEILNTGRSVFIGNAAGANDSFDNNENIFIGDSTGHFNTTGADNVMIGTRSGALNISGSRNAFLGSYAGERNTTGENNVYIGSNAGERNTTGKRNTYIGDGAGRLNTSGSDNVFIGYSAGYNTSISNKLYIHNNPSNTPLIYGDFNTDSLQINGKLNINGAFNFPTTDGLANQILSTDGNGTVDWTTNNGAFNSENGLTSSLNNEDDFIFGADSLNYNGSDVERKFFFDKSQGAFRAGQINNNNWDVDSLGIASLAFGFDTKATGDYSTAMGDQTTASGFAATAMGNQAEASDYAATAMGDQTTASGFAATAMGKESTASGFVSTALGNKAIASGDAAVAIGNETHASGLGSLALGDLTTASGFVSTALGSSTTASAYASTALGISTKATGSISTAFGNTTTAISYGETAMGMYNTTYSPNDSINYDEEDRLFVLGNGRNRNELSDALIIYKNGNTEINGAVTIDNAYTLPTTDGTNGQVLQSDGNGNVSWEEDKDTDNQNLSFNGTTLSIEDGNDVDLTPLVAGLADQVPIGTIQMWPTETAPSGWLLCNGSTFNTSTYPDLNSVLGGNTLPDFRGRFPLGQYSNSDSQNLSGLTRRNIGDQAGAETHTLSINEMPAHSHSITFGERSKGGGGNNVTDLDLSGKT